MPADAITRRKPLEDALASAGIALAKIEAELPFGEVTMGYDRNQDAIGFYWQGRPFPKGAACGAQVLITLQEFIAEPQYAIELARRSMLKVFARFAGGRQGA